ncbi:glycerophosphodiester phosphodiesterase [Weissella confusa]|uniref:glycerophosphodiester phosphodiesterase n=1 Tax=Weissella confusa TaxID=1583 RepID=UPI0022E016C3|nr:glycerophosphodiester phosphodiesterase family protein [Weissella confusa]
MDKLITNLDTNLGPVLREQLDTNFQKIQNGVDGQLDSLNKQIEAMLGDVPLQDKNEVTQARIDDNNVVYSTLKGRLDADQSTAETALKEERMTGIEVKAARSNTSGKNYDNLKARLDDTEANLTNNMDAKIAQISSVPETFTNLSALQSTYPNGKTGLFVTADTGHKYIWANSTWTDAGIYQSVGVANRSIKLDYISASALQTPFVPSRDGAPNLNSQTLVLDFNAKTDYPFVVVKESNVVQIPINSTLTVNFNSSTVIAICVDTSTGVPTFRPRGTDSSNDSSVVIGYLRMSNNRIIVSGALADTLLIDGVPNSIYYIGSEQMTLTPSAYGVPNFNSSNMTVDFMSKSDSQAVITRGKLVSMIPTGLVAQPTGSILQNGGRSFKLWYNTTTSKAWVTSYAEKPTDESLLLATFFASNGTMRSSINMTVDGHFPDEEFFSFTPSHNGNPFYDVKTNTLDFNCYTDQAYIRYNGVNKQIPLHYYIQVPELIVGSTARILYNPTTNEFKSTGWQASIPVGYIQVASIRLTRTTGAISQGAFQIDYLGNHGNNGYIQQSKFIKQIAHRGFNVSAPEQSKLAYTMASTYGVNEWEGDIQFTLDNVPVLWHDDNIKGYALDSNGNALTSDVLISQTNYADLIKYDFGSGKSPKYKGTPILSVEEMFKLARIYDANMHLEFKGNYDDAKIHNLVNLVNKYGVEPNLSWQSFNSTYFQKVVKLLPKVPLEFLTMLNDDNEVTRLLADMDSFKSDGRKLIASADSYNSSVDRVNRVTDYGYPIYIWTVDDPATVNKFADCLVSGFMTNGNVDVNGTIRKWLMS